jgi:SAM-dependent MidA family methyltransferase
MTFARFMELALYDPEDGYYRAASARPGRSGDFLTAPEAHPIYGWALARQVDEVWARLGRPDDFVVREPGAGAGTLAVAVLDGLRRDGSALADIVRWQPVEMDERRDAELAARLSDAGFGRNVGRPSAEPIRGIVLANEVLDALPVHRVVRRPEGLREVFVGWRDGAFADVEAEPSSPGLADRLASEGVDLADGQRAEICLALDGWIAEAAASIRRGLLLAIDYGWPAAALYDPERRRLGTLRAYVRHRVHDDPYRNVGRQDLTAHVDVTAVERAAAAAGLHPLGTTSQAEFLTALGAGELLVRLQEESGRTLQDYLDARAALARMLDPAVSGAFRVMAFGRDLPHDEPLRGFAFRLAQA